MKSCIKSYTLFEMDKEDMTRDVWKFDQKCNLGGYIRWLKYNRFDVIKIVRNTRKVSWK